MNPLGRVVAAPAEVIEGLRLLPSLARDIATIAETTHSLPDIERAINAVSRHTAELGQIAEATHVLPPMDDRMATIEGAMPVLVEVQGHLTQLPETIERLDTGVTAMAATLERLLASLDELNGTLARLEGSVGPLGRLAQRLPGGRRGAIEAEDDHGPAGSA